MEVVPGPEVLFRWSSGRFNACKFGGESQFPAILALARKRSEKEGRNIEKARVRDRHRMKLFDIRRTSQDGTRNDDQASHEELGYYLDREKQTRGESLPMLFHHFNFCLIVSSRSLLRFDLNSLSTMARSKVPFFVVKLSIRSSTTRFFLS